MQCEGTMCTFLFLRLSVQSLCSIVTSHSCTEWWGINIMNVITCTIKRLWYWPVCVFALMHLNFNWLNIAWLKTKVYKEWAYPWVLQQGRVSVLGRFVNPMCLFFTLLLCTSLCKSPKFHCTAGGVCRLQCAAGKLRAVWEIPARFRKTKSPACEFHAMLYTDCVFVFQLYFCFYRLSYSVPFWKNKKSVCVLVYCAILWVRKVMFVSELFPASSSRHFVFCVFLATFHGCDRLQCVIYLMCKIYFHKSFLNVPAFLFLLASCTPKRTLP